MAKLDPPDARATKSPDRPTSSEPAPPKRSFAAIQPPKLELPTGGGAIRGMGETFRVNAATGTASASIPIPASAAPRGPTPSLALSYDSGAGNGVFGLGWSLSLPQIARKTDRRLPEYADREDSDVFLLSGAEDLVPVLEGGERVVIATATEVIERFRPRTEGLFSRIDKVSVIATGEVFWRAVTRDNVTSVFGDGDPCRIAHPERPAQVFAWLLSRTIDDRGHVVTYEYAAENLDGVDAGRASERHRTNGLAPIANRHLKRVRYGNTIMGDAASARFEIVFDYGDHDPAAPGPDPVAPWSARRDPFSSYRAGFEMRTYRLCRRVLVFHRFAELGEEPCLVRALELDYTESERITTLTSARPRGYTRDGSGAYSSLDSPPVSFRYASDLFDASVQSLDAAALGRDFPRTLLGSRAQWVDLDGEGIPGLVIDDDGAIRYKRNLGDGRLGAARLLPSSPGITALAAGESQLVDVAGAGTLAVVRWTGVQAGFQERVGEGWGSFVPFESAPGVRLDDPNARLADLDGDGFEDLIVTRGDRIEWYPSKAREGFGPARTIRLPAESERGPRVVFADASRSILLADMSGDGLADLVRVTHDGISYWPNLGYGRFGAEVRMHGAPELEPDRDRFDARRVRLADLDGTGPSDLLYFREDGLRAYRNESGNGWSSEERFAVPPSALASLALLDLFGTGTMCIVWSPPSDSPEPLLRFVDPLAGEKPHLLVEVDNHMGALQRFEYAPSTRFYLEDQRAGTPWATKLPFPVQVVARTESYDAISRTRFTSRYTYHHGHYDSFEREFRGFVRVDRLDAERFGAEHGQGLFPDYPPPVNGERPVPPVLVKTWFHTGAWRERAAQASLFEDEYWRDPSAPPSLASVLPPGLPPIERREAARALRGTVLREEVYGLDGSADEATPYSVAETSREVRRLQPRQPARGRDRPELPGVFHVVDRESRSFAYERDAADPRLSQTLALSVDAYGTVTRSAAVAYPRRVVPADLPEQGVLHVVVSEEDVVHVDGVAAGLRLAIPIESRTWELTGLSASSVLDIDEVRAAFDEAAAIPYHTAATGGFEKRILQREKVRYYDSDDLPAVLPFGQADARALAYESYLLDLTDEIVALAFGTRVTAAMLAEAGYVTPEGESGHWMPSGHAELDRDRFYLPVRAFDPFGASVAVEYDAYAFLARSLTDALGNVVGARHDYRVLAPVEVTDANGNRGAVAFDDLGRVTLTAVMGKAGSVDGDTLADPTTRVEYATHRWEEAAKPNFAHTFARERHGADNPRWQETYAYSDGSGRIVMTKVQAEPGLAPMRDASGELVLDGSGTPVLALVPARWVGNGRTVVDNKGNPIKKYEPYFSSTFEYEDEAELVETGVTPVLHYDPLGRLTRTDFPNGTHSRAEWTPWLSRSFDANDTVLEPGNRWYAARLPDAVPTPSAEEVRARAITEAHAATASTSHLDSLGRAFFSVADSGGALVTMRTRLDVEGQPIETIDPLGRVCQRQMYSIGGVVLRETNLDKGTRLGLVNVLGQSVWAWDDRGHRFRNEYDALRRSTRLWVAADEGAEALLELRIYGESASSPELHNLRGRAVRVFDGAGVTRTEDFDFKGNSLSVERRLAIVYDALVDWSALAPATSPVTADSLAAASLESEVFVETRTYDALNRAISTVAPDGSELVPGYNEAGLLESVQVRVRGAATPTAFVDAIDYDAKGRRTRIAYASGAFETDYEYDPITFLLTRARSTRASDSKRVQDLRYTYDPVGNVVEIRDSAQQEVFYNNAVVLPANRYVYDALYRLVEASGREHASLGVQHDADEVPTAELPHANAADAVRNYREEYVYDRIGNVLEMFHRAEGAPAATWRRFYDYGPSTGGVPDSNRLRSTSLPGDTEGAVPYSAVYTHDAHGSMTSMPHLAAIAWSPFDRMASADLGGGGEVHFTYDAAGERIRKVRHHVGTLIEERIYLGGFELYRKRDGAGVITERETLHVLDGARRIALCETKTVDGDETIEDPVPKIRYQLDNHLGSALLELDPMGLVISYEEYHPYGTSAYRSARSSVEVSARRYRYVGKERDDETGLYLMGARYYAPWLGRWTSADPLGIFTVEGPGLFNYALGSPITATDPAGTEPTKKPDPFGPLGVCRQRSADEAKVHSGSGETIRMPTGTAVPHVEVKYGKHKYFWTLDQYHTTTFLGGALPYGAEVEVVRPFGWDDQVEAAERQEKEAKKAGLPKGISAGLMAPSWRFVQITLAGEKRAQERKEQEERDAREESERETRAKLLETGLQLAIRITPASGLGVGVAVAAAIVAKGTPQKTPTPGHDTRSEAIGQYWITMDKDQGVAGLSYNLSYTTATRGAIQSNLRPDVLVEHKGGTFTNSEVLSPTENIQRKSGKHMQVRLRAGDKLEGVHFEIDPKHTGRKSANPDVARALKFIRDVDAWGAIPRARASRAARK